MTDERFTFGETDHEQLEMDNWEGITTSKSPLYTSHHAAAKLRGMEERARLARLQQHDQEQNIFVPRSELDRELQHLPALSDPQMEWHRRRAGMAPEDVEDEELDINFEPGAELTENQLERGKKLFGIMDSNGNGKLEPNEIEEYFVGLSWVEDKIAIPDELVEAVTEAHHDGRLGPNHFLLFLSHYKANHGNAELNKLLTSMTRMISPELSDEELQRGVDIFCQIDLDESGTIEGEEMLNFYSRAWPEGEFPWQLLYEEEGHISVDAWFEFLIDVKRTKGEMALATYLGGREINFELKRLVAPSPEIVMPPEPQPVDPPGSPPRSPPRSPLAASIHEEFEEEDEEEKLIMVNDLMEQYPELVYVTEALLVANPTLGRNMLKRHLKKEQSQLANIDSDIISAILAGCKVKLSSQLEGLQAKDRERMADKVGLSADDIAFVECRALDFFAREGSVTTIISNKTQVSASGEVHDKSVHVCVTFQRCDPRWPSFGETGMGILAVLKPGQFDWVTGAETEEWIIEPLRPGGPPPMQEYEEEYQAQQTPSETAVEYF